jgi:hypothetical protein
MQSDLKPGDYLMFQLEAGYALLRLLAVDDGTVWHVAAYEDFFLDVDGAEAAIEQGSLRVTAPHIALTHRAFESTQTARIVNKPLSPDELTALDEWRLNANREVADRSVRLMLGWR